MEEIGKGEFGSVYNVCKLNDCEYVMKSQFNNKHFHAEVNALYDLQESNAVPRIYDAWTCDGNGFFVMEKLYPLNPTSADNLYKAVSNIKNTLNKLDWLQLDPHQGNIMRRRDGQPVMIDFGFAVNKYIHNPGPPKYEKYKLSYDEYKIIDDFLVELYNPDQNSPKYKSAMANFYELQKQKDLPFPMNRFKIFDTTLFF